MITITSERVGTIEVSEDRIITFPEGVVGFEELKQFIVADDQNDSTMPFKWLVPLQNPNMLFLVADPGMFYSDYVFDLPEEHREFLGLTVQEDVAVMSLLTIPSNPARITANLKAPLLVNWKTMIGRQIILKNTRYQTKHYIFVQQQATDQLTTGDALAAVQADEQASLLLAATEAATQLITKTNTSVGQN